MGSISSVAAAYALGGLVLAVGLVVLLHVLEPEFDPAWRMLSEYSLGRYGALMRVAFLAVGSGVIAVALALSGSAWPWSLGLVLVAIGPLGAAFVDTDPITTPRAEVSRTSNVHAALGSLFSSASRWPRPSPGSGPPVTPQWGRSTPRASIAPWVALAWFIGATLRHARPDGRGAPDVRIGWPNRVSMLVYLGWAALAAILVR